jgi:hypothetical protein
MTTKKQRQGQWRQLQQIPFGNDVKEDDDGKAFSFGEAFSFFDGGVWLFCCCAGCAGG